LTRLWVYWDRTPCGQVWSLTQRRGLLGPLTGPWLRSKTRCARDTIPTSDHADVAARGEQVLKLRGPDSLASLVTLDRTRSVTRQRLWELSVPHRAEFSHLPAR
jgi:hypothetical protein